MLSARGESTHKIVARSGVAWLAIAVVRAWIGRAEERVRANRSAHPTPPRASAATRWTVDAAPRVEKPARPERTDPKATAGAQPVPTSPWEVTKMVFKEFGRDSGSLMAAAVAFYLLLSVIPMVLLGAAIVGYMIHNPARAIDQTFRFLNQFLPIGKQTVRPLIEGLIRQRGSLSLAGAVGLALTATGGFATLENAINGMWNRPNRNFIMNKLYAFLMMLVIGALFALSMGSTFLVGLAARSSSLHWLANGWLKPLVAVLMPLVSSTLMFAVIYRFYPNGRSGWRQSLIAGVITAALWEIFKWGYGIYASRDSSPYGIVIGLVTWIYYSCTLILLGSELTWILEGCPDREGKEQVHAQRNRQRRPGEVS